MDPGSQKIVPTAPPEYNDAVRSAPEMYRQAPSNFQVAAPVQREVVVVNVPSFDRHSQQVQCPHCLDHVWSKTDTFATMKTHLIALLCCIFFLCGPCIYCVDSCKGVKHYCPKCKNFLGSYSG